MNDRPAGGPPGPAGGTAVLVAVVAAWAVVLSLLLTHRVFVSLDSVSNYAHVWFIARQLWHAHHFPFAMPSVGHGHGLAFPYASVPWLVAALAWPALGDWGVTLALAAGAVAVAMTTFWAFPELRRGWWAAAVLADPALVLSPIVGQLPFLWATALLLAGVACWRRGRWTWATVLVALAQITHPAVVLPMAALLVAGWLPFEPDKRALLVRYALSVVVTLPFAALVVFSPVFSDASLATKISEFFVTLAIRSVVILVPLALLGLQRLGRAWLAPAAFAVALVPNFFTTQLNTHHAWRALRLDPDSRILAFIHSPAFVPGETYRVLSDSDSKMGMYLLLRNGGRLDSEFFPESLNYGGADNPAAYARFLRERHVDVVVAYADTTIVRGTNERRLLDEIAAGGAAGASPDGCPYPVSVERVADGAPYGLYRVQPAC